MGHMLSFIRGFIIISRYKHTSSLANFPVWGRHSSMSCMISLAQALWWMPLHLTQDNCRDLHGGKQNQLGLVPSSSFRIHVPLSQVIMYLLLSLLFLFLFHFSAEPSGCSLIYCSYFSHPDWMSEIQCSSCLFFSSHFFSCYCFTQTLGVLLNVYSNQS